VRGDFSVYDGSPPRPTRGETFGLGGLRMVVEHRGAWRSGSCGTLSRRVN
jgi:hypothetical protein